MTYEEIKEQAMRDLREAPQKTWIACIEAEQRYRKAFQKVLSEKGGVTLDDIRKELDKPS